MSTRADRIRRAMFTLAPLAFAAAAWLMPRVDPTARVGLAFDRKGAVELAARELAVHGVAVEPAEARVRVEVDDALERYLRLRRDQAPEAVAEVYRLAPPFRVRVVFPSRDGKEESEVRLAPDGRTVGLSLRRVLGGSGSEDRSEAPASPEGETPAESTGKAERTFLERLLGPDTARGLRARDTPKPPEKDPAQEIPPQETPAQETPEQATPPQAVAEPAPPGEGTGGAPIPPEPDLEAAEKEVHGLTFSSSPPEDGWEADAGARSWNVALEGLDELSLAASTRARDGEVEAWGCLAEVEPSFREARLERGEASLALRVLSGVLLFLASGILLVWGLWRYWLRFQEAEVSHGRTLLLAFTVALLVGGALFYLLESSLLVAELDDEFVSGRLALMVITLTVAASVLPLGLLLGAVWSGCEGDVRAIFPDRLTSLDALLAGRWLSRNPARSLLAGAAGAAWVVLAQLATWLPWLLRPEWGPDLAARRLLLVHPFQTGVAVALAVLIPYSALGLLAPLSLLRRWTASRWRTLPVLGLFLWLVCLQLPGVTQRLPAASGAVSAAVWAAGFLVAFFAFDLMAAFWTFLLAHLGMLILLFLHQPGGGLRQSALLVAAGVGALLTLAALVRRFGREVSEVEVRPGYARNILERLALSAELDAARQARARMLPAEPPALPGARLSACSSAAEGDYYDYFRRPDGSVALAAADFGRHGLAAALRLTLAKGFLLSYSDRSLPPAEASRRLKARLSELVDDSEEVALVYGVFDPEERSLELVWDQGGVWVLVRSAAGSLEELLPAGGEGAAAGSRSATLSLRPGDMVLFLVTGRDLGIRDRKLSLQALPRRPWRDAEAVLRLLRKRGSAIGTVVLLQVGEGVS